MTGGAVATGALRRERARPRALVGSVCALLVLGAALVVGIELGPVNLGVLAVVQETLSHAPFLHVRSPLSARDATILWELRAPRVVLGALVGGMLALAGAAYQGVFRNQLADPYLLGIAAGAGLGATLAVAYGHASRGSLLPLAAFAGGAAAVAAAYVLGRSVGGSRDAATLVLAGVTVTVFFTAIGTFVQQRHSETLREVYSFILGGLDTAGWGDVATLAPYVGGSALVILAHRRLLDVLMLGDDEAAALGVDVARVRLVVVVAATVGTAAAVSLSGLIGFVGIIVPHAIRLTVGASYRVVLPLALVAGGAFLVLADVLARTVMAPAELPIGVVTAFFGAPFFALVLRTTRGVSL
jgi:iron complex transport system permease protein